MIYKADSSLSCRCMGTGRGFVDRILHVRFESLVVLVLSKWVWELSTMMTWEQRIVFCWC